MSDKKFTDIFTYGSSVLGVTGILTELLLINKNNKTNSLSFDKGNNKGEKKSKKQKKKWRTMKKNEELKIKSYILINIL